MSTDKPTKQTSSTSTSRKPPNKKSHGRLTQQQIKVRLALPDQDPNKLYQGIFLNNQAKKNKGGRIKCKQLPNKVEVPAKLIYETLHESEVYWNILRKVNKAEEARRRDAERAARQDRGREKEKYVEKKQDNSGQAGRNEEEVRGNQEKKENTHKEHKKEVELPKQKKEQKKEEEQFKRESDSEEEKQNTREKRPRERREQEVKQNKDHSDSSDKEQQQDAKEKELDTIIARIIRIKRNPYEQGKQIVCTLLLPRRSNLLSLPKNPSPLQEIEADNYIDAIPINPRLPLFQLRDLAPIQKALENETKIILEKNLQSRNSKGKKGTKKITQLRNTKQVRNIMIDIITNYYVVIKYDRWYRNQQSPQGIVTKLLKKIKTPEGQCQAYLHQFGLTDYQHKQYPPVALQVTPDHIRYDKLLVFTIDPQTSVDLDDALSIIPLDEKTFQVGIHISDVSSYIKLLDRDHVSKLSTSVYLPYEVKHMLPHAFVDVCTLRPNVDRLAFSVFLKMDFNGEVLAQRYEKTIIHSRSQLSYELAQSVIQNSIKQPKDFPQRLKLSQSDAKGIIQSIHLMNKIATARRNKRCILDVFNKHEIRFELDQQNYPTGIKLYVRKEAHKMIEEFMILGNEYVAKKLCRDFGGDSLVIHHPPPSELNQQFFNKFFQDYKFNVHFKSMKELQEQIKELISKGLEPEIQELLILKASRSQELASYARNSQDSGASKEHFALNLTSYTHFTSPMRRFADIVVHEQLLKCLKKEKLTEEEEKRLTLEISRMNEGRQATKRLKGKIVDAFFCLLVDHTNKPIITKAIITSFGITSVSLFIPEYDLIKEIIWKKEIKVKRLDFEDKERNVLIVSFENGKNLVKWRAEKHSSVEVEIDCTYGVPLEMVFGFNVEVDGKKYHIKAIR